MSSTAKDAAEYGERLARWIEDLGLAGQLKEAGLPTMVRDCHGQAIWRDPGNGEPLTLDQLAELDHLLHDQGDEPRHGVPVALVQLRRRARLRADLLASPSFDYESLAALRGTTAAATRFAVHKASGAGELLVVAGDATASGEPTSIIPGFQLDAQGTIRSELVPILQALAGPAADGWAIWAWLTHPAALLGGAIPAELVKDPAEAPLVRFAATKLAAASR